MASKLEDKLYHQLHMLGIAPPEREYRFAAEFAGFGPAIRQRLQKAGLKDWRADFAYPKERLIIEVEGIVFAGKGGRHQRGAGMNEDLLKYHSAMDLGWNVYRCGAELIKSGQAARLIEKLLGDRY